MKRILYGLMMTFCLLSLAGCGAGLQPDEPDAQTEIPETALSPAPETTSEAAPSEQPSGQLEHRSPPADNSRRGYNIALFVRADGLYAADILYGDEICLDQSPEVAQSIAESDFLNDTLRLELSPDGGAAAYVKQGSLYVAPVDFEQAPSTPTLVCRFVEDFLFDGDELLFTSSLSTIAGELLAYNWPSGDVRTVVPRTDEDYLYTNMTLIRPGRLAATRSRLYDGQEIPYEQYVKEHGIMAIDTQTGQTDFLLPNEPNDHAGDVTAMFYVPVNVSSDGRYLYLFHRTYSGSISTDGVDLVVYDLIEGCLRPEGNWGMLPRGNELAVNPVQPEEAVIMSGGNRELFFNKAISLINAATGEETRLTGDDLAPMTPGFSHDGRRVAFSACPTQTYPDGEEAGLNVWDVFYSQHSIMEYDKTTGKTTTLTDEGYNMWPCYLADDLGVVFVRRMGSDPDITMDLCLYADGQVWLVAEGICSYDGWNYYGHYEIKSVLGIFTPEGGSR